MAHRKDEQTMMNNNSNQNRPSEPAPILAPHKQLRFEGAYEISVDPPGVLTEPEAAPTQMRSPGEPSTTVAPGSKGKAVGYVRVSTEDQTQGYSLDAQRVEIERYCEQHGYDLVRFYSDEGVSAHTDKISKRPELSLLLEHARRGQFDVVLVHTIDRWARNMRVQTEALQILGDARVGFASVAENIDYTTPEGELMLTMIGGFAEFFSKQLARHVQKGARQRVMEHGLPHGSVPFGYRTDGDARVPYLEEREAEAVQRAFAKRIAGESYGQIAHWLDSAGFETRRGNSFMPEAVRDMLSCRFYLGLVKLNGQEFPGQHEAIISPDLFERVQLRIVKRGPSIARLDAPRGLLAGVARCAHCGRRLQADRGKQKYPMYRERHAGRCATNRRSCTSSGIDSQIQELFCSLVLPDDWRAAIARESVQTEGPSVSDLENDRRRLARAYGDGGYTLEEYEQKLEQINTKLRLAQVSTPIELDEVANLLEDLPALWSGANSDEHRRLLRTLVQDVYVDIASKRVVGIAPVAAFRTLIESAIEGIAGASAIIFDPAEIGESGCMELVETGEN